MAPIILLTNIHVIILSVFFILTLISAAAISRPQKKVVRAYFIGFIPRSLHIFLARLLSISVCLGIDERLF